MPNPKGTPANLKPFKKGCVGNPGGKTSEQKRLELANAEKAMRIRAAMLDEMILKLEDGALEMMDTNGLKMLKDAEDRGLGAPIQDVRSSDGSMSPPKKIELLPQPLVNDDSSS